MSVAPRGEDWYRSRIAAGREWAYVPGARAHRMPRLKDEDWLPLDMLVDVPDPDSEADPFEQAWLGIRTSEVRAALDCLHLRSAYVLRRVYEDDQTLVAVARELSVSPVRIAQIKREAEKRVGRFARVRKLVEWELVEPESL
jgi:DNA-directed RNA polymerase sigma subunit (sigma70/sigma32)